MRRAYMIYNPESKEYYTGKKNYEWTDNIYKAMVFLTKPTMKCLDKFKHEFLYLEIKTVYIPKK